MVAVYVDDILVTGDNSNEITTLKAHLHKVLSIKDLSILHFFLGIEVSYVSNALFSHKRSSHVKFLLTVALLHSKR